MNTSQLFNLKLFNSRYDGYFADRNYNLYSLKTGRLVKLSPNTRVINAQYFNAALPGFKPFVEYCNQKSEVNVNTNSESFIIAIIDDNGHPVFSREPKVHTSRESAVNEVTRLANSNPGAKFSYFKREGTAVVNKIEWS